MKNRPTTGVAALVALGVSVGLTANVSAAEVKATEIKATELNTKVQLESTKVQLEGATVNREVSTKNLKTVNQPKIPSSVNLEDMKKADSIKMDGPPRP